MTVQMMLVTLALVAFTCDAAAGSCTATLKDGTSFPDGQFKTSLGDRWCSSSERSIDACGTECCENKKDRCVDKFAGRDCKDKATNYYYDPAKGSQTTTDETADVDCCSQTKKCDISCSSGYEQIAGYATKDCTANRPASVECARSECCQEINTCAGVKDRGSVCSTGYSYKGNDADVANTGNFNNICCQEDDYKTCQGWLRKRAWTCQKTLDKWDEHFVPRSMASTSVPDDDEAKWQTACCTEKVIKCSEYTQCHSKSGGGWAHNVASDATECMLDEGFGSATWNAMKASTWKEGDALPGQFCSETCCKADKLKCRGYPTPHEGEQQCSINYHEYKDIEAKAGNPVAHDGEFRSQCCTKQLSCQHWKDNTSPPAEAAASGANHQHTLVAAPFFMVVGVLTLSN